MPQYHYRAVTTAGEVITGQVDAPTRDEVIQRLRYLGHLPIDAELTTRRGTLRAGTPNLPKAPRARDVTRFLRELAFLLGAGLTLEETLKTLGEDAGKDIARFAHSLRQSLASGDSFAEALERHPTVIHPAYVAMIRAGEAAGKLDRVLTAIVEDRDRAERLADQFSSSLRYPLVLIGAAFVVMFFFLMYVVPQFEPIFKDLGGRLNGGAAFVLSASAWLRANFDLILGLLGALTGLLWLVLRNRSSRARLGALLSALPGIAGPVRDRRTARLVGMLGMLVGNGVGLPASLKLLRDLVSDPSLISAIEQVHDQVRSGRRFADALSDTMLLPPLAVRMLRVGDEAGDLAPLAAHAAQFYEQKLATSLDRLMAAVGPITIVIVSLLIGGLVVSIMTALLSITELAV